MVVCGSASYVGKRQLCVKSVQLCAEAEQLCGGSTGRCEGSTTTSVWRLHIYA
jgi:hypothetical protein